MPVHIFYPSLYMNDYQIVRTLFFLFFSTIICGCAVGITNTHQKLTEKRWFLEKMSGYEPLEHLARIDFDREKITITPGCNRYEADYHVNNQQLVLEHIKRTDIVCTKSTHQLEEKFINQFRQAMLVTIDQKKMTLSSPDKKTMMHFSAQLKANQKNIVSHVWQIHPRKVSCGMVSAAECYYIREQSSSKWIILPHEIEGFDFHPGVSYQISVLETRRNGRVFYVLDTVLKQSVKGTRQGILSK